MCENPWKKCKKKELFVFIIYKGRRREICKECWEEIAESDKEWGSKKFPKEKIS